jgi:hypothetical protein
VKDNYGRGLRPATRREAAPGRGALSRREPAPQRAPRRVRWSRIAAVFTVAACAAVLSGCGGSSSSTTGGSSAYTKAEVYAQCMRAHGIPSFPDPDAQGQFPPIQIGRNGVSQQAVQSAESACQSVHPGGAQSGGQQQQGRQTQALNFSKCMRAHGVLNFPDPSASNGGMGYNLAGVDTQSPQYQSAQQACRSQQSAGGLS